MNTKAYFIFRALTFNLEMARNPQKIGFSLESKRKNRKKNFTVALNSWFVPCHLIFSMIQLVDEKWISNVRVRMAFSFILFMTLYYEYIYICVYILWIFFFFKFSTYIIMRFSFWYSCFKVTNLWKSSFALTFLKVSKSTPTMAYGLQTMMPEYWFILPAKHLLNLYK